MQTTGDTQWKSASEQQTRKLDFFMCVFKAEFDLELMSCKSRAVCFPLKGKRSPRNQLEMKSYFYLNISWFGE